MSELVPELRDVVVRVERVPFTRLVHLDVVGVGGLVLTAAEAHDLARDLRRHASAPAGRPARRRSERARGRADARPTGAR